MNSETKKCPHCAEEILAEAKKCKHCGEFLDETQRAAPTQPIIEKNDSETTTDRGVATLASIFIPGLGHIIQRRGAPLGIILFIFTVIGYFMMIVPGLILHFLIILSAATYTRPKPKSPRTNVDISSIMGWW